MTVAVALKSRAGVAAPPSNNMATEEVLDGGKTVVVALDKQDVVTIIGLLAAQLGNVTFPGNMGGATPSINITDRGVIKYRLILLLDNRG